MKKGILTFAMVLAILFLSASPFVAKVHASTSWTVTLYAKIGANTSFPAILGVANDATNDFDEAYDAVTSPPPLTGVEAYFWYPSNNVTPVDLRKLSTSIIPPSGNMNWTYKVHTISVDGTMVINWTAIPAQYSAYIRASNGTILADMTQGTQYSYAQDMDVTITFTVNFVIPEFPIAPLIALLACFASYGVFKISKRP